MISFSMTYHANTKIQFGLHHLIWIWRDNVEKQDIFQTIFFGKKIQDSIPFDS
jgi:hypothetical protein